MGWMKHILDMSVQDELWLKLKCASFAEGDQRAVSYWPHLQLLQLAGEGLFWHSLCGPREAAGKSHSLSRPIWGSNSCCGWPKRFLSEHSWCILVLMVIDHLKLTGLGCVCVCCVCLCVNVGTVPTGLGRVGERKTYIRLSQEAAPTQFPCLWEDSTNRQTVTI